MRLNPDCVRDVMVFLEENLEPGFTVDEFQVIAGLAKKHSNEAEVRYSLDQLVLDGYLEKINTNDGIIVRNILPPGHAFLAKAKNPAVWKGFTKISKEKGSNMAISVMSKLIQQIAEKMLGLD